jgi:hypothetical protein
MSDAERLRQESYIAKNYHREQCDEVERLRANCRAEQQRATVAEDAVVSLHALIERLRAQRDALLALITEADNLRARWLNDGHELGSNAREEFNNAKRCYDAKRASIKEAGG